MGIVGEIERFGIEGDTNEALGNGIREGICKSDALRNAVYGIKEECERKIRLGTLVRLNGNVILKISPVKNIFHHFFLIYS